MFFVLSKIVGFLINVYNLVFICILIFFLFNKSKFKFFRVVARSAGIITILIILVGGFSAVPNYLIWKLENTIKSQTIKHPDGIILLGGSFSGSQRAYKENQVGLNGRAERVVEALRLLNKHPNSELLFVSDASVLTSAGISEADQAMEFFTTFKINPNRLIIKTISNNTYQESVAIAKHLKVNEGNWIIVTSAAHMPRTVALMQSRDIGRAKIYPYLTDFTGNLPNFNLKFSFSNIGTLNNLVHEVLGLIAYRVTGRSSYIWPNVQLIPISSRTL